MSLVAFFWAVLTFSVVLLVILRLLGFTFDLRRLGSKWNCFLLTLVLLLPFGFLMDLVHELGHVMWGTAVGGKVVNMQIAYFQLYPYPAITQFFVLGLVNMEGIPTSLGLGLFLLGGSLATNLVSWLIAGILASRKFGIKAKTALCVFGCFGWLDLPFYVVFPQVGLRHWIFFGGRQPEPLVGARLVGLPDSAFYLFTFLTTLGLCLFYVKPVWKKAWKMIGSFELRLGLTTSSEETPVTI